MSRRPSKENVLAFVGLTLGATVYAARILIGRRRKPAPGVAETTPTGSVSGRPRPVSDLGTLALKYVALAAAAGALVFAIKALVMVGFDAFAAAALASSASPAAAVQMLLAVTPGVGLLLSLVTAYQLGRVTQSKSPDHSTHSKQVAIPLIVLTMALLAPALLQFRVGDWTVLIPVAPVLAAFLSGRSQFGWGYITVIFGVAVLLLISFVYTSTMWLPKERIRVGEDEFLVHITAESDTSLDAYIPANRAVLRLEKSQISERQYCTSTADSPTFGTAWRGSPLIPRCPDAGKSFPVP